MYQGKFDAKKRGQKAPEATLQQIIDDRNAAKQQEEARRAEAAKRKQAAAAAQKKPTQNAAAPAKMEKPLAQKPAAPAKMEKPLAQKPAAPVKKAKKGSRVGGMIFYTMYFLFIFVFLLGTFVGLQWLNGWLLDYEAAQPTAKCEEVFNSMFSNPDWADLYEIAHVEDTQFEGVEQFAAYMTEKAAGKKLDYVETSAGLSTDKKYILRIDGEKIGMFTLTDASSSRTDIPDWKFGSLEFVIRRNAAYRIEKMDVHTAYVNGVPLGDSYTIQTISTKAEKFLPVGTAGVRVSTQEITGLLAQPEVVIYDQTGNPMEIVYDPETCTFAEQTIASTITEEEEELVLNALKAYSEFMINAAGARNNLAKYFDSSSSTYSDILKMGSELWMNHDYGHRFLDMKLTGFARYSSELFSVRASMVMNATFSDGKTGDFDVSQSMFFRKKNGKWVCYEMTNEDATTPVGEVRLTFMNGNDMLLSEFFDVKSQQILVPVVAVPEGKVFSGWVRETTNDEGKKVLTVVFVPDENGKVTLGTNSTLEPMTVYALFENAPEA